MWYDTKKAILKHLGKNEKSVRSLDRLIKKGVVLEKNGRYTTRNDLQVTAIRKLQAEVKELKKSGWNGGSDSDLEFQIKENERLVREHEKEIKDITQRCWDYMSRKNCLPVDNMAQFKYWIKWEDYRDIQFSHEELSSSFSSNFSSNDNIELPF